MTMTTVSVRLPEDLSEALQKAAQRSAVSPSDFVRTALVHYLDVLKAQTKPAVGQKPSAPPPPPPAPAATAGQQQDRYRRLVYEVAKNRCLMLRVLDAQVGHEAADHFLDLAAGDAESYVKEHLGG